MKLPFRYYGDPILRKKAEPVQQITPEIRKIVTDMVETLQDHPGWGLAAPQVGHSVRIFLTLAPESREETVDCYGPLRVFINPVLTNPSNELRSHAEGCFSIPKVYPIVTRPAGIAIQAMDLNGQSFERELWGWEARVIMHENDHLNGVLFIDRISANDRKRLDQQLRDIKKRYHH